VSKSVVEDVRLPVALCRRARKGLSHSSAASQPFGALQT
jgi:hypothetical protein